MLFGPIEPNLPCIYRFFPNYLTQRRMIVRLCLTLIWLFPLLGTSQSAFQQRATDGPLFYRKRPTSILLQRLAVGIEMGQLSGPPTKQTCGPSVGQYPFFWFLCKPIRVSSILIIFYFLNPFHYKDWCCVPKYGMEHSHT